MLPLWAPYLERLLSFFQALVLLLPAPLLCGCVDAVAYGLQQQLHILHLRVLVKVQLGIVQQLRGHLGANHAAARGVREVVVVVVADERGRVLDGELPQQAAGLGGFGGLDSGLLHHEQ